MFDLFEREREADMKVRCRLLVLHIQQQPGLGQAAARLCGSPTWVARIQELSECVLAGKQS